MKYDKQYLYNMYNATSTDDGKGDLETYESWLERQLISRLKKIEALDKELKVTDSLLNERQRVLDAIPECEAHGKCVPHAIEWVKEQIKNNQ